MYRDCHEFVRLEEDCGQHECALDVVSFGHLTPDQLDVRIIPDIAAPAGSERFCCSSGPATQPVRREEDHGQHGLG